MRQQPQSFILFEPLKCLVTRYDQEVFDLDVLGSREVLLLQLRPLSIKATLAASILSAATWVSRYVTTRYKWPPFGVGEAVSGTSRWYCTKREDQDRG